MFPCQQIDTMLPGYLDGELAQGDRQRVELHLESCAKCRVALEQLSRLHAAAGKRALGEMTRQDWRAIMDKVVAKTSRGTGWVLYLAGLLLVCGYGGYAFFADDTVPALIKTGIGAIVVGVILLFVSVLRERLAERKSDKYEDVQL